MKKFSSILLASVILLTSLSATSVSAKEFSSAVSIWPIDTAKGVWYTEKYTTSNHIYDTLDSPSVKHFTMDLTDGVWRACASAFAQRQDILSNFIFVNGGAVVDLSTDSWLYYDFTMQDVQWGLSLTLGIDGNNSYDIGISLQRAICRASGTAELTNDSQYGVAGVYQGRINLNDVISESGKNLFGGIDLVGQKVHIVSGGFSYAVLSENDAMEIRAIEIGHGDRSFEVAAQAIEQPKSKYVAKNVVGEYYDVEECEVNLISSEHSWKVSTSATEVGVMNSWTSFLKLGFNSSGIEIKPTGKSATYKAYTTNGSIGWPVATASFDVSTFGDTAWLVYDLETKTKWDILLHFNNNRYSIGFSDVFKSINKNSDIESVEVLSGTRGLCDAGSYTGALNIGKIAEFYVSHFGYKLCSFGYLKLSGVTVIYENTENSDTSLINTIKSLKIVKGKKTSLLDRVNDTVSLTTGVYYPERQADFAKSELEELCNTYSSLPSWKYTEKSYKAVEIALSQAETSMGDVSLDTGGEWLFCRPHRTDFCTQNFFRNNYVYDDPVLFTSGVTSNGKTYQKLTYNHSTIGIYSNNGRWGQVSTQYRFDEPVKVDFKNDVLNLDILFDDDTNYLQTGNIWLVFENLGLYEFNIPSIRYRDILGGGEYVRLRFSTYMDRLGDEYNAYLAANGYQDNLLGIIYNNRSVYYGTITSNPNPSIYIYEASLTKTAELENAIQNIKEAVATLEKARIGDINLDGAEDSADLVLMRKVLLGLSDVNCDINCDGDVNIIDLIVLKKYLTTLDTVQA